MSIDEIYRWLHGGRRHWCMRCKTPVRRLLAVTREGGGHRVTVQCHGELRTDVIPDTRAEDHPTHAVKWWTRDYLVVPLLDRHGRTDATPAQGAIE